MRQKRESLLLLVLPIIAAFDYVVAHKIIENATDTGLTNLYQQFYFFVIATAIFHLLWGFVIILICMDAFNNIRFWRILTSFIIMQTLLLFSLAVEMTLFMSQYLFYRDGNINFYISPVMPINNIEYLVTWSAVAMACLWFDFIIFLLIVFRHIYWYEEFVPLNVEDPSRMERK